MRVSCLLIADYLSEESVAWFCRVEEVVDELVIFLRETGAPDKFGASIGRLRAVVHIAPSAEYYFSTADFRNMLSKCSGDWILMLDHDEELSEEWDNPRWRDLLGEEDFSHFYLPRRWLTSKNTFLARAPWWPDWQLRLFRNDPAKAHFPAKLHDSYYIEGRGGWLPDLAIHHHDLRLAPRAAREKKAELYRNLREEHDLGYFYLYEDFDVSETPLPSPTPLIQPSAARMEALRPAETDAVRLIAERPPAVMLVGKLYWTKVTMRNDLDRDLGVGTPSPVNVAYHWLEAESRRISVFDGARTGIVPAVRPKSQRTFEMLIFPPGIPGEYLLQIAVVQENVCWLEPVTFPVRVKGQSEKTKKEIARRSSAIAADGARDFEERAEGAGL